jgi:hypothetical protein
MPAPTAPFGNRGAFQIEMEAEAAEEPREAHRAARRFLLDKFQAAGRSRLCLPQSELEEI